jgi:hypothetical protein
MGGPTVASGDGENRSAGRPRAEFGRCCCPIDLPGLHPHRAARDSEREARMRIGIAGVGGRMGRLLIQVVAARADAALAGGTVRPAGRVGADLGMLAGIGERGITATDQPEAMFQAAEVVIDFTNPAALATHLDLAARHGTALVIGTSGLSLEQERAIAETARAVPIVYAANFSSGVALLLVLVRRAAATLGQEYDIEIVARRSTHPRAPRSRWAGRPPRDAASRWRTTWSPAGTATPASGAMARSASPPCAAARWSASTPRSSPPRPNT